MIYADNAATTQLDIDAFEAMKEFLVGDYANASQPYSYARKAKAAIKQARTTIAECIGAKPEEIFFTSCGTESDNWVIKGSSVFSDNPQGVITSCIEHHAILHSCAAAERLGKKVIYLPVNCKGEVEPDSLESSLNDDIGLVSIMMGNNEIGTLEPIKELCAIAHKHGALFHTDAVQTVGHVEINVKELDVDFLSASGHKFNGPKGIGFLYKKEGVALPSYLDGGSQEAGLRSGTENVASIVAMAVALKKNCDKLAEHSAKLKEMEQALLSVLDDARMDYVRNGGGIPGNISLSFKGAEGEMLLHRLDLMSICISTGSACDSVNTQISHVIQAINVPKEYAVGTVRISLGVHNTLDEAIRIAKALVKVIKK